MPPKIRDLIAELEAAGFQNRGGKGSHRNSVHARLSKPITISRKLGDDAKRYQIRAGRTAIAELILGGCHGDDEQAVFEELCQIVDETIALHERDWKPVHAWRRNEDKGEGNWSTFGRWCASS
jgi:predicted RNA binding protein YcfA (HicA-like mRNA interferase family)